MKKARFVSVLLATLFAMLGCGRDDGEPADDSGTMGDSGGSTDGSSDGQVGDGGGGAICGPQSCGANQICIQGGGCTVSGAANDCSLDGQKKVEGVCPEGTVPCKDFPGGDYCMLPCPEPTYECVDIPAACGGTPKCDCFGETELCPSGGACVSFENGSPLCQAA